LVVVDFVLVAEVEALLVAVWELEDPQPAAPRVVMATTIPSAALGRCAIG
jgi:hypothetical protein